MNNSMLIISLVIIGLILVFLGWMVIIAWSLVKEIINKVETPINEIMKTEIEYPFDIETELSGWAVKKLCKLNMVYPGFERILNEAITFTDFKAVPKYDVLENSVKVYVTVYGKKDQTC